MRRFTNLVGGAERASLSGTFQAKSAFYDYGYELPNASLVDIKLAVSTARHARAAAQALTLSERCATLERVARDIHWSSDDEAHLVRMTGMPVKHVRDRLARATRSLAEIADAVRSRYGESAGHMARPVHEGDGTPVGFEVAAPPDDLVCGLIPANDPGEAAYVIGHSVASGASLVLKPSALEPLVAFKLVQALTEAGYPAGALNVLYWNIDDPARATAPTALLAESGRRIFFGTRDLVEELFPPSARFSGVNCLFTAGNSKALVHESADLDRAAQAIVHGAFDWTLDCVTTRAAFVPNDDVGAALTERVVALAEGLKVGDPLDPTTDVGFVDNATDIATNLDGAVAFRYGRKHAGACLGPQQLAPFVFTTATTMFPTLTQELPYVLTIATSDGFDGAVNDINAVAAEHADRGLMGVSLFCADAEEDAIASGAGLLGSVGRLRAHHVAVNKPTLDVDLYIRHQEYFLTEVMTRPLSVTLPRRAAFTTPSGIATVSEARANDAAAARDERVERAERS